jgi:hypothetical protein
MAYSQKDWDLKAYVNDTDTDLIVDAGTNGTIVKSILICNTGSTAISVIIKKTDSAGVELARILPFTVIEGYTTTTLEIPLINLSGGDKIMVQAAAAGIHFSANGAEE